jgi:hypothetical protein
MTQDMRMQSSAIHDVPGENQMSVTEAAWVQLREYARERPEMVILWSFGIGFILGWKLKPW